MGEKSALKKQYIVDKSKEVFAQKGFREVTMKELVEACDISRGGLYLHFPDTESVFEAVLEDEGKAALEALKADGAPADVLLEFLEISKQDITKKKENLCAARIEYKFALKAAKKEAVLKKQLTEEIKAIESVIANGVKKKGMVCDDPTAAAKNIVCALDGLRVMAATTGVTSDMVDKEINCIMGSVGLTVK